MTVQAAVQADQPLPRLRQKHRCSRVSQYKGVAWDPRRGQWHAQFTLMVDGRIIAHEEFGYFDPEEEELAGRAYDSAIRRLYGASGLYNFPREGEKSAVCDCDHGSSSPHLEAA